MYPRGLFQVGLAPVTQQEVDDVLDIEQQIQSLREFRDRQISGMLNRALSGCPIEAGRHSVELKGENRGARRTYYLTIDGRPMK